MSKTISLPKIMRNTSEKAIDGKTLGRNQIVQLTTDSKKRKYTPLRKN
jgi:hypothetical protein